MLDMNRSLEFFGLSYTRSNFRKTTIKNGCFLRDIN